MKGIPPVPTSPPPTRRLLITAGPTQEPIDAVRFIGNRSSGRLGVSLADHAAAAGWETTLLLGPTPNAPSDSRVRTVRFRTTAQLGALLDEHFPSCDVLVMAAAVADYRPITKEGFADQKLRRTDQKLVIELEPTPDLLAACGKRKRPDQLVVGFALEPRERLIESATSKLERKNLDLVVANPLETMDSETIEATVLRRDGTRVETGGKITKGAFAGWLMGLVERKT
jgi:phosphopantothenoylcysteine decarboxylase/phosphopantothenate--cysteine ligase